MPREAACARAARWASVRWAGRGPEGGGAHGVVGVGGERAVRTGDVAGDEVEQGGGDDGRVDVDAAEVEGAPTGGLVQLGAGRGLPVGPPGGVPAVAEEHPVRRRAAAKSRTRARAASRVGAPVRSSPVRARPVDVVCTCASVNAGVTRAPSRSITSSTPSAKASAAPSEPTQATWPRSTTIAVAKGRRDCAPRRGAAGRWWTRWTRRWTHSWTPVSPLAGRARHAGRPCTGHGRPVRPRSRHAGLRPGAAWPRTAWRARRWSGSRRRPGSAPGRGVPPARAGSTPAP